MIRKLTILTVLAMLIHGPVFASDAPVDEVAALKAELASTKAELHKIKYANTPPIEKQIKPTHKNWKDAYGDTEKTQVYFNIKLAIVDIERCRETMRLIVSAINNITNLDDPNSLASRMAVLEARPDGTITGTINEADIEIAVPCEAVDTNDSNKALKPDDPNEVAK